MKPRFSEERVINATGKGWAHWFAVLDKFDCKEKGHKASAKMLESRHKIGPWWAQSITIEYEVVNGIREQTQRSDSLFGTDVQRSVNATIDKCWELFTTPKGLNSWFNKKTSVDLRVGGVYTGAGGDRCTYKRIVPKNRIRMTWEHPKHTQGSLVEINFAKTGKKSIVRVSHTKIATKKEREDLKKAWQKVMDDFKKVAEKG